MKFTTVTWYSQLLAIVLGIGIFGLGVYVGSNMSPKNMASVDVLTATNTVSEINDSDVEGQTALQTQVVSLEWQYEVIENTIDYPKTKVTLILEREGAAFEFKDIAVVDGSCNLMPVETPLALGSEQLLCYYAGFGYQYRVIDGGSQYLVQQKEIEEASPDYNPPVAEFKTILKIDK